MLTYRIHKQRLSNSILITFFLLPLLLSLPFTSHAGITGPYDNDGAGASDYDGSVGGGSGADSSVGSGSGQNTNTPGTPGTAENNNTGGGKGPYDGSGGFGDSGGAGTSGGGNDDSGFGGSDRTSDDNDPGGPSGNDNGGGGGGNPSRTPGSGYTPGAAYDNGTPVESKPLTPAEKLMIATGKAVNTIVTAATDTVNNAIAEAAALKNKIILGREATPTTNDTGRVDFNKFADATVPRPAGNGADAEPINKRDFAALGGGDTEEQRQVAEDGKAILTWRAAADDAPNPYARSEIQKQAAADTDKAEEVRVSEGTYQEGIDAIAKESAEALAGVINLGGDDTVERGAQYADAGIVRTDATPQSEEAGAARSTISETGDTSVPQEEKPWYKKAADGVRGFFGLGGSSNDNTTGNDASLGDNIDDVVNDLAAEDTYVVGQEYGKTYSGPKGVVGPAKEGLNNAASEAADTYQRTGQSYSGPKGVVGPPTDTLNDAARRSAPIAERYDVSNKELTDREADMVALTAITEVSGGDVQKPIEAIYQRVLSPTYPNNVAGNLSGYAFQAIGDGALDPNANIDEQIDTILKDKGLTREDFEEAKTLTKAVFNGEVVPTIPGAMDFANPELTEQYFKAGKASQETMNEVEYMIEERDDGVVDKFDFGGSHVYGTRNPSNLVVDYTPTEASKNANVDDPYYSVRPAGEDARSGGDYPAQEITRTETTYIKPKPRPTLAPFTSPFPKPRPSGIGEVVSRAKETVAEITNSLGVVTSIRPQPRPENIVEVSDTALNDPTENYAPTTSIRPQPRPFIEEFAQQISELVDSIVQ